MSELVSLIGLQKKQLDQLKAENDKYSLFIEKICEYAGLECDDEVFQDLITKYME